MSTGRQTLTNASSPMNARSPTASVAHGSRWPPPPIRIERPAQMPAPRNARRQRSSRSAPNWRELPDRDDLLAPDRRARAELDAVLEDDPRSDDERAVAEDDVPSPIDGARPRGSASTFSSDDSARNVVRIGAKRLEECADRARRRSSSRSNVAGSVTPSVETPASAGVAAGPAAAACCARSAASTSFSVMKPRFSIDARSMPWQLRELDRLPRRLAVDRLRASARASARGERRPRPARPRLSATSAIVLPSSTSTPVVVELDERPAAGRLDLDRRLRRLDDADGLPLPPPRRGPRRATRRGARTRCSRLRA